MREAICWSAEGAVSVISPTDLSDIAAPAGNDAMACDDTVSLVSNVPVTFVSVAGICVPLDAT